MPHQTRSNLFRAATVAASLAAVAALALLLRGGPVQAQAQGPMSAPACQCSAPTPIPGMTTRVAHCLCGALSCAIAESAELSRGNQMQCVRQ
jgi:hypothetical protein